jgi:hypothetical protein
MPCARVQATVSTWAPLHCSSSSGLWTMAHMVYGGDTDRCRASTDYSDTTTYTEINVGGSLANGRQKLRIRAQYDYTAEDGSTKTQHRLTSPWEQHQPRQNSRLPASKLADTVLPSVYKGRGFLISTWCSVPCRRRCMSSSPAGNNTPCRR